MLQLYHGDCLERMKLIADNSIDLIICDLPYGVLSTGVGKEKLKRADNTEKSNNRKEGTIAGCAWDIKIDLNIFWREVRRIRKSDHTPCLHFCNTKFGVDLINSNPEEYRYDLIWNKMQGVGFLSANKKPMSSHEMIYIFSKKSATYNRINIEGGCPKTVIDIINKKEKGQHPTAKPPDLYKWLIERYSNEGDTVLDPTFGSGNSGIVCKDLHRNYIGIELNEVYFKKGEKRLINEN